MNYRTYISRLLYSNEVKALANKYLYGTRYDLFTEYQSEAAGAKAYVRRIMEFDSQVEIEFYILMDYLTFIPFGQLGRKTCAERNIDISSLKYDYSMLVLDCEGIRLSDDERHRLKLFFDTYDDDIQPITPVGYANIARRISDRLFNMIYSGECAGSIGKSKLFSYHLRQLVQELFDGELKQFDVGQFLKRFPDLQSLNESQTEYLSEVLNAFK